MPDGTRQVPLGKIGPEDFKDLEIARGNGSVILWATICLEQKMNRAITNFFLGPFNGPSAARSLFENEVISSASFPFSFKKQLIDKLCAELPDIDGRTRSKTQGCLKKIITWRNAFAHGHLQFDSKKGVLLNYYSGSPKTDTLTDAYWDEIESVFAECDGLIGAIEKRTNQLANGNAEAGND